MARSALRPLLVCVAALNIMVSEAGVVWECNNFPTDSPMRGCRWNHGNRFGWGEHNIASVQDPTGSSNNVLRVFYPRGSYTNSRRDRGGCQFRAKPFEPVSTATLQYDVYFSENFDFVKGGKLPGFYGGTGSCTGGGDDKTCFSTRYMFRRHGDGELYGYIPNDAATWFCDGPNIHCNFNYGHSFGRGTWRFVPGRWYRLSQKIRMNTPRRNNGLMVVKVDDREVYRIKGIKFRHNYRIRIDTILFATFFGGSTRSWASRADVYTYFKNFTVIVP